MTEVVYGAIFSVAGNFIAVSIFRAEDRSDVLCSKRYAAEEALVISRDEKSKQQDNGNEHRQL